MRVDVEAGGLSRTFGGCIRRFPLNLHDGRCSVLHVAQGRIDRRSIR